MTLKGGGESNFSDQIFFSYFTVIVAFLFYPLCLAAAANKTKKKTLKEGGFFLDGCPAVRFIQKHRLTLVLFTSAVYGSSCKKSISSHSQRVMDFTF